jgi:hypothetical protein
MQLMSADRLAAPNLANHKHDLQMGSDQAAELRDEYSSLIRSKIINDMGLDFLMAERWNLRPRTRINAYMGWSVRDVITGN